MKTTPTYEQLKLAEETGQAHIIDTAYEGTAQLWSYEEKYWVVLPGNSVISQEEDNKNDAIFPDISQAAGTLGRKGGSAKSPAKAEASRVNGAKGGRPKNLVKYQVHFHGPEVSFFADTQASNCELYHKAAKKLTGDKTACFCQSSSGIPGHGQIMKPCSAGGLTSIEGWGTGVMTIKKIKGSAK